MAKRGRKPAPPEIKILAGTRADRIPTGIPAPDRTRPEPPAYLDDEALGEWGRMVERLDKLGTLATADGPALGLYCTLYSRLVAAEGDIARNGIFTETAMGGEKPSPAVTIAAACIKQMAALLIEFGCTPSSRGRVKSDAPAAPDALGQFLLRKQG